MLFVHDVHAVIGEHEFDLQDLVRERYAPAVAEDEDTRLLWYLHASHGSGEAYYAVMVTAARDGAAWERLTHRLRYGDLADYLTEASKLRYHATSSLLVSTDWSPLPAIDLAAVPPTGENEVRLFREDTLLGPGIASLVAGPSGQDPAHVLQPVAGFRPAVGTDDELRIIYEVAVGESFTTEFGDDVGWNDWSGSLTPAIPEGCAGTGRYIQALPWSPMQLSA